MRDSLEIEQTPDGLRLVVSRAIAAPAERVWDLFANTDRWADWGPSVTAVETDQQFLSQGMTGRVRTVGGFWLPFVITDLHDFRWSWRIGPVPGTGHRVESVGDSSRAAFEVPLFAFPYLIVCWIALRRIEARATGD